MLDCIKNDLLAQKERFMQMKNSSLVENQANAEQQIISPKLEELEKQKQEQLNKECENYNKKVDIISSQFEIQKENYRQTIYKSIEDKVNSSFEIAIANIDNQLKKE